MTVNTGTHIETKEAVIQQAFESEKDRLLGFISRRIDALEDAEDILQDVFYELADNYSPLAPIERTAAWLYRVARNKITDWYRKKRTTRLDDMLPGTNADDDDALLMADIIPSFDTPADKKLFLNMVSEELSEALDMLPDNQREVFVMHELEGVSLKDIAMLTGVSIKTVISRKRYAVLFLREQLQELYNEFLNN